MRYLLILSYDTKDEGQAQRIAENIEHAYNIGRREDSSCRVRLEGVYQQKQLDTPTRTA